MLFHLEEPKMSFLMSMTLQFAKDVQSHVSVKLTMRLSIEKY